MDIDPEKNPFETGAEIPGYDETGEMTEMAAFLQLRLDVVHKILQVWVLAEDMQKLHLAGI